MDDVTRSNVIAAMEGEAAAYARYTLAARHARASGLDELATLYEETAEVELNEHFVELADLIGAFENDEATLVVAIEGERDEASSLYPRFAQQAAGAGEIAAAERFTELAADEREHLRAFERRLAALPARA